MINSLKTEKENLIKEIERLRTEETCYDINGYPIDDAKIDELKAKLSQLNSIIELIKEDKQKQVEFLCKLSREHILPSGAQSDLDEELVRLKNELGILKLLALLKNREFIK